MGIVWGQTPGIHPIPDDVALISDDGDSTKKVRIEASAISPATTRVLTMPDQNIDLTPDSGDFNSLPVVDTTSLVKDPADATKLARMDVGNIATATTRILEMPDADVLLRKNNFAGAAAPSVSDDNTQGYAVGSYWFDTTNDEVYGCTNAATGAAEWQLLSAVGGMGLEESTGPELTIATGSITPTHVCHTVDTEADAGADDLDTIDGTNASPGDVLILQIVDNGRNVTLRNGIDNLLTDTGSSVALINTGRRALCHWDGTRWLVTRYDG